MGGHPMAGNSKLSMTKKNGRILSMCVCSNGTVTVTVTDTGTSTIQSVFE